MTEVIIYHVYNSSAVPLPVRPVVAGKILSLAKILAVVGIILIIISYLPSLLSLANFQLTQREVENLTVTQKEVKSRYQPKYDPKLHKANHLTIAAIGVDTNIQEATRLNYEEALKKGVWRVSDFGSPNENGTPVILAAHRFGYLAWTNIFRRKNSFFNLPKLKVGDTVEVVYQQRKYIYEVYAEAKGEEISDYSADLILYTCETLNGPERIFKYARLLEV